MNSQVSDSPDLGRVRRWYWIIGLSVLLLLLLAVGLYAYSRSPGIRHASHMDAGFKALGMLGREHGPDPSVLDTLAVLNWLDLNALSYRLLIGMEEEGLVEVELSYWGFSPEPVCVREQIASRMVFEMAKIESSGEPDRPLSELLGVLFLDPTFIDSVEPSILEFC